ncbi:TlpA family protein disulfide reductase [Psychroflexus sp. CAK57W]|uniref:TlpA family protein disulfide reductase n=1 Tax=Psychroflexus curvus TaxID=2873595 RepID=UPI001CCA982C|nr:TlpA disulfide reductase family protein [Psychroflexus curvus]MBZ9786898.1 TlpA family protein disulfide reductase [Psychroflexus curvus]
MAPKKNIKKLVLVSVIAIILILVYSFINTYNEKQAIEKELLELPELPLNDLDGNTFDLNDLKGLKLLVFMDTDCMYCKYQIEDLKTVRKQFDNLSIVGISEQPIEKLKDYIATEPFFNNPKNFITHDFDSNMADHYRIGTTPHLLIYDAENNLIEQNKGYMKADKLIAILKTVE